MNFKGLEKCHVVGCKTVYPGSIPGVASSLRKRSKVRRAVCRLLPLAGRPGKISAGTRMGRRFVLSKRDRLCYMRRAREQAFPR